LINFKNASSEGWKHGFPPKQKALGLSLGITKKKKKKKDEEQSISGPSY
jgi:hypothetical protein